MYKRYQVDGIRLLRVSCLTDLMPLYTVSFLLHPFLPPCSCPFQDQGHNLSITSGSEVYDIQGCLVQDHEGNRMQQKDHYQDQEMIPYITRYCSITDRTPNVYPLFTTFITLFQMTYYHQYPPKLMVLPLVCHKQTLFHLPFRVPIWATIPLVPYVGSKIPQKRSLLGGQKGLFSHF